MSVRSPKHPTDEALFKLSRTRTWSGTETKPFYGPDDAQGIGAAGGDGYRQNLGDPGQYPFTRGAFPQMYRSRMWSQREIVGYGAPADTRAGLELALNNGVSGFDVVVDVLTQQNIDPDHPSFAAEVGLEGASVASLRHCTELLDGVDLTRMDVAWHSAGLVYPMTVAFAREQGLDEASLLGSHMPDCLHFVICGWGKQMFPTELARRVTVDCLEYAVKRTPKWSLGLPQAYDLRERGATPAGEIGIGMAIVVLCLEALAERGVSVDEVAPRLAWVSTSDIDFFEEVAKFRALRRTWARMMVDRFGAEDPRSARVRMACHTSGKSLVYEQPLNNIARAAIQTFAAICGGVQSVETCTYDEPISIPTNDAKEIALRTQQILAHEVGAARTADPLGGSYYVETLTDAIEQEAQEILARIEEIGIFKAIDDGIIEEWLDAENLRNAKEMESGERLVIGQNAFRKQGSNAAPPMRFEMSKQSVQNHIREFRNFKAGRDMSDVARAVNAVYDAVRNNRNPYEPMVLALLAEATIGEIWGALRLAVGQSYDPFNVIEPPFPIGGRHA